MSFMKLRQSLGLHMTRRLRHQRKFTKMRWARSGSYFPKPLARWHSIDLIDIHGLLASRSKSTYDTRKTFRLGSIPFIENVNGTPLVVYRH